jgi:tetratricopeptide (TPR) repeat protein
LNLPVKLLLLILLAMPRPLPGQQNQDTAFNSLVASAQQAQAANDYATAADDYKQAVKLRPDIPELWANLGLMQHETKNYDGAIHSFKQALRLKSSLYVPNLFLGVDYMRQGNASEATPYLVKAETMNATDSLPPMTLGRAYSSQEKYALAARAYERALHLDPAQSSAWFGLGITRLNQVEQDARHVAEEDPNSPYAKTLYAESLVKQSRYKEAADSYKSVLSAKPQPPCIHAELGFLSIRQQKTADAETEFQAEREADPGCSLAILGQARLRIDAGSSEDALKLLEDLWKKDPGFLQSNASSLTEGMDQAHASTFQQSLAQQNSSGAISPGLYQAVSGIFNRQPLQQSLPTPDTTKHTAQEDYASGRYAQCAGNSKSSLKTKNPLNLQLLAACAYFTGDYDLSSNAADELASILPHSPVAAYWSIKANEHLAFTALEKFQQLEPNSARSHLLLGDIYRQRNRFDDAQAEYQKALDITPDDPAALLGLASAYFGDANIDKTIQTAQLALNKTPNDPDLNLLMAEALLSRHQFATAEPFLQQALHAKPQMLPHVHALLGQVYADAGKTQQAIEQLNLGAQSDQDGSIHYQLARLYRKAGDTKASDEAIEQMKVLQQQRRQHAAIAIQDPHSSTLDEP